MQFTDTHCHIHSVDYPLPITEVDAHNAQAGVEYLLCVGENAEDSALAVEFVANRPHSWASVGLHPHDAKDGPAALENLRSLIEADRRRSSSQTLLGPVTKKQTSQVLAELRAREPSFLVPPSTKSQSDSNREEGERRQQSLRKIVAVGECGLDYFYGHSSKEDQEKALRYQIELALEFDLPLVFHVRDAFDDFWPIFDAYRGVRGVLHSFTDDATNLSKAIARGLYIGVNGIVTFTENPSQLEVARQIPPDRLVLETDSPFLTPVPLRGKVNEPAHVLIVARFLSELRQISLQELAQITTTNARQLFSL
jgi:TatD DNase family protein